MKVTDLPGDVRGIVIDAKTSLPIDSASVGLDPSANNSSDVLSGSDGVYLIKNIEPGSYKIKASKAKYEPVSRDIVIESGETNQNDFTLSLIPWPEISPKYLDFGEESTSGSFTIKNIGSGTLHYTCQSAVDWIEIAETYGDVTAEADIIHVTIDRSAISEETQKEIIRVISYSDVDIYDTVQIYVNGLMDKDENYYNIVTIGTQTWMAENLNTGKMKIWEGGLTISLTNNGIPEKYCYENSLSNCKTYGGLYTWDEMMDYVSMDDGVPDAGGYLVFESHQGICPHGWHIPTDAEWSTLLYYVGPSTAGATLKADSPLWRNDTIVATDEFGYGMLPAGGITTPSVNLPLAFIYKGGTAMFWQAYVSISKLHGEYFTWVRYRIENELLFRTNGQAWTEMAFSVRCIKDTE